MNPAWPDDPDSHPPSSAAPCCSQPAHPSHIPPTASHSQNKAPSPPSTAPAALHTARSAHRAAARIRQSPRSPRPAPPTLPSASRNSVAMAHPATPRPAAQTPDAANPHAQPSPPVLQAYATAFGPSLAFALSMTNRAIHQLLRVNVILINQFPPLNLLLFPFRPLPPNIKNL